MSQMSTLRYEYLLIESKQKTTMAAATAVVPISSNEVARQCRTAWNSVKDECDKINKPENDTNMKFFRPTVDCESTIDIICNEYPQQVNSVLEVGSSFANIVVRC